MSRAVRILLVANDGFSAGHVTRTIAIARGLARIATARGLALRTTLLTTSEADTLLAGEPIAIVRLPAPERARRAGFVDAERRRMVAAIVDGTLEGFAPDLVVADTFPNGPHDELARVGRRAKRALIRRAVPDERALAAGIDDYDLAILADDPTPIATDLAANGGSTITLAFATGECGTENWGGVPGAAMATANVSLLNAAGIKYILSTGGAAGTFSCGSDAGFATFLDRWAGAGLVGVDLDIEAGQTPEVIQALVARIAAGHTAHPSLRFSLTLATLANNDGAPAAHSIGAAAPDSFNVMGDNTLAAVKSGLGFTGDAATWPSYLTVALMVMDYGAAGPGVCVAHDGLCDMGQSAIQAAYNLHDHWNVPFANIELTPMIGGNDNQAEHFSLADVDAMSAFAIDHKLAGVHYWSYDRDTDCPVGSASPTCNSLGGVGTHGFLARFLGAGMH